MPKTYTEYIDELDLINTKDELFKFESFEQIKKLMRAAMISKRSHQKAQQKKTAILKIAKQMLADGEITLPDDLS